MHWSSKIPFKYKRNAITGELHRARRIASGFDKETKKIDTQNMLLKTLSRILTKKDKLLIPLWLFGERKHVTLYLPFSSKNGKYCGHFIKKLVSFIIEKVKFNIAWNT